MSEVQKRKPATSFSNGLEVLTASITIVKYANAFTTWKAIVSTNDNAALRQKRGMKPIKRKLASMVALTISNIAHTISSKTISEKLAVYGLTHDQYQAMLQEQNGVCAICKRPPTAKKRLAIDHDHDCCPAGGSCGKCVRGLLCFRCNSLIGRTDADTLRSAIAYLGPD